MARKVKDQTYFDSHLIRSPSLANVTLQHLLDLNNYITESELNELSQNEWMMTSPLFVRLLQTQGNPDLYRNKKFYPLLVKSLSHLDGPKKILSLKPVDFAPDTFAKWSDDPLFSDYLYDSPSSVLFRGIHFQTGDLIVKDSPELIDGLWTIFNNQRNVYHHFAIFIVLEKNGRKIPTVFHMDVHGVRPVPLSTFFSPNFTSNAQIMRLKDQRPEWAKRLRDFALNMRRDEFGYDFCANDADHAHLTCTELGALFFECTGEPPIIGKTRFNPRCLENLKALGLKDLSYLDAVDYVRDQRLEWVGNITNGNITLDLARILVANYLSRSVEDRKLNLSQFDSPFKPGFWIKAGSRQIQKQSWIGKLLGNWILGFNKNNFPDAAPNVYAFSMGALDPAAENATPKILRDVKFKSLVKTYFDRGTFSIHDFEADSECQNLTEKYVDIQSWF